MHPDLTPEQIERFWSKVDRSGGPDSCWEWRGSRKEKGYGQYALPGVTLRAHRVAWVLTNGPIPDGIIACHHCDNPPCCNPAHVFLGTRADNTHDMLAKKRNKPTRKLTPDQVREIRAIHASGAAGYCKLGRAYGVSLFTIRALIVGRSWRDIS